jgi:hypothetical protein
MLTRLALARPSQAHSCTGRLFHAFRSAQSSLEEKRDGGTARSSTSARANASEQAAAKLSQKPAQPQLVEIPRLPLFGSMLPFHSGFKIDPADANGTFRKMSETYGSFYSLGLPGVGQGWEGTLYVTDDPDQMMKVLRQEGMYPSGSGERQWVLKEWFRSRNFKTAGMYERCVWMEPIVFHWFHTCSVRTLDSTTL